MVTCLVCTYGRYSLLRELITFYCLQKYRERKMIIFNNHPVDLVLSNTLKHYNIKLINSNKSFSNLGEIREEAIRHVETEYVAFWDDDDIYLPSFLYDGMQHVKTACKPKNAYIMKKNVIERAYSRCESSVISKTKLIKGYHKKDVGCERLWYEDLKPVEYENKINYIVRWREKSHISTNSLDDFRLKNNDTGEGFPLILKDVNYIFNHVRKIR